MDSKNILALAKLYAKSVGLSLSTVSTYMAGSGDVLRRLELGHDLTTRRSVRLATWLSDHWPPNLKWPSDIPRPAPTSRTKQKRNSRCGVA